MLLGITVVPLDDASSHELPLCVHDLRLHCSFLHRCVVAIQTKATSSVTYAFDKIQNLFRRFLFFPSSLALSTEFSKMGKVFGKNLVLPVIIAFKLLSQVETCFQSFRWPVPYVLKHKRRFEQSLLKKRRKYVYMSLYLRITNKVARRITNFYPAELNIPL